MKKFRCCFLTSHRNKKKYYREWLSSCGWGVMLSYDTIMAYSVKNAQSYEAANMYAIDKSFEFCYRIKKEHLHFDNDRLSELYGHQEHEDILYGGNALSFWIKCLEQARPGNIYGMIKRIIFYEKGENKKNTD